MASVDRREVIKAIAARVASSIAIKPGQEKVEEFWRDTGEKLLGLPIKYREEQCRRLNS